MKLIKCLILLIFPLLANSQDLFGDKCLGVWKGTMYIYNNGNLRDSVLVKMTVEKTNEPTTWTWKTEYLSPKNPMTKNYTLKLKDKSKNLYITDEGGGLELYDYLYGNKLYCLFETHEVYLTSTYELKGDELIFEVTSGKKLESTHPEVRNFGVSNLQRVVFRKQKY